MRMWLANILIATKDNYTLPQILSVLFNVFPEKLLLVIARSGLQITGNIKKMVKIALSLMSYFQSKDKINHSLT